MVTENLDRGSPLPELGKAFWSLCWHADRCLPSRLAPAGWLTTRLTTALLTQPLSHPSLKCFCLQTLSSRHSHNFQNPVCWQLLDLQPGLSWAEKTPPSPVPRDSSLPAGQSLVSPSGPLGSLPHLGLTPTVLTSLSQQKPCLGSGLRRLLPNRL